MPSHPSNPDQAVYTRVARRLIPFLFLCYIVAFLDRVNVGFAKLQMQEDLRWSDAVFGLGAGIFFIGYFLFEVPSNLILHRVGARRWIARIMISWGLVSSVFVFTADIGWGSLARAFGCSDSEFTFYLLRLLLGVAEAGFFPGIILYLGYWFPAARRARITALFMTAIAAANVIGSPLSGAILQYTDAMLGWRGWQWLFLLEGLPSVLIGLAVLRVLPDGPFDARWLSPPERALVLRRLLEDEQAKSGGATDRRHALSDALLDRRVWLLAVVYFCCVVSLYAVNFWMPTLIQEFGIERGAYLRIGLLGAIPWGCGALFMVWYGAHSDRSGERAWHVAGALLAAAAGLVLLAWAGSARPLMSMLALTLVTCGTLACTATFWSLPTVFLSGTAAAAGIAWINSVGNLGGHLGPDLIGRIRAASGGASEMAFLALAGFAIVGAAVVVLGFGSTARGPGRK